VRGLGPGALEKLDAHAWPGNVRELENVIERAMIVARGAVIGAEDIVPSEPAPTDPAEPGRLKTLREAEIDHIRAALAATGGNESHAARILGIHRDTLYRKIRRYRIVVGAQITTPDLS
jgi:DNA-binding NtrC family response regulator